MDKEEYLKQVSEIKEKWDIEELIAAADLMIDGNKAYEEVRIFTYYLGMHPSSRDEELKEFAARIIVRAQYLNSLKAWDIPSLD